MKNKAWLGVKFLNFGFALQEQGEITCKEKLSAVTLSSDLGQGLEFGQSLLCRAESLLCQPLLTIRSAQKSQEPNKM